jgi:hypothetical protein
MKPDVVVVATGSTWMRDGYNGGSHMATIGAEQDNVVAVDDVVAGKAEVGEKVIIFDCRGDITASGVAELLADRGCKVQLVAPIPNIGGIDQIKDMTWFHVTPRMLNKGVVLTPQTFVMMIAGKTVTLINIHTMGTTEVEADTVILISGKTPNDGLYEELEGKVPELYKIGEARNPHSMGEANRDGHWIGRLI